MLNSYVAFVTLGHPGDLTLTQLRDHCASMIADYKLPRELIIAAIPRNASGKVLKHELRRMLDIRHAPDPPRTSAGLVRETSLAG